MQYGIDKKIKLIKIYKCGYCVNDLGIVFKEYKIGSKDRFYANCILLKHEKYGYILVDTGYDYRITRSLDVLKKIYNTFNPTYMGIYDSIIYSLQEDGIEINDIKYVIITHSHPDHIGMLRFFKNAKIIMSYENFINKDILIFKDYLVFNNINLINFKKDAIFDMQAIDLFLDKSIYLINLPGHSKGQIGLIIKEEKIIFIADACWKKDEIDGKLHVRKIAGLIHKNLKQYINTQKLIRKFLKCHPEYRLICSHDL